jgi:hypothetical protein
MGHSYRQDLADDVTAAGGDPVSVPGLRTGVTTLPSTVATAYQIAATPVNVYTANGAISVAHQNAIISKLVSAAAMTLAAPTVAQDNLLIRLIAGSAFAHVITATGLIDDGVTGGAKNSVTLGAFVGACVVLLAYNGHWILVSKTVATIA